MRGQRKGKTMEKSTIIRAMTRDGSARITFIDSTAAVKQMAQIHSPSKTMTAVLGRAMSAASPYGLASQG